MNNMNTNKIDQNIHLLLMGGKLIHAHIAS